MSLAEAVGTCLASLLVGGPSVARVAPTIRRFVAFCDRNGVTTLQTTTSADVESFVKSRLDSGLVASISTRHNRRSAVRLLFRTARREGLVELDPTVDVELPPRSSMPTRPLTDDEIELCRDIAWWRSTRTAVAWALAEATARGAEIGVLTPADVDLTSRTVWIHGGSRTEPRTGSLTEWGVAAIRRGMAEVPDGPLTYNGTSSGAARQVSTCRAIGTVLLRAGLAAEPDVRPSSVSAWAGRREFLRTGRIEDAAAVMGVRSLDRAARLVGRFGD
jgi:integrase/recombinase XerC